MEGYGYGRLRVYVKVEPRSTLTFTCGLSYILFHLRTFARKNYLTVETKAYVL